MPLAETDEKFIQQRERLLKLWTPAGCILATGLITIIRRLTKPGQAL